MKKILSILLICTMVFTLCACNSDSGSGSSGLFSGKIGNVSASGDPMEFFVSGSGRTLREVENEFGSFDSSEEFDSWSYAGTEYTMDKTPVFGEDWEFTLTVKNSDNSVVAGTFAFSQGKISDKKFEAYRDEIVEYYTSEYGEPQGYYEDSAMPVWSWTEGKVTILIQDCRADRDQLHINFVITK